MEWQENLKLMKEKSGLKTAEIAERSGIPEPTLEKLFAGTTKEPKLPTIHKLVHFLGYTIDDLYRDITKNPPAPAEPEQGDRLTKYEVEGFLISLGLIDDGQHISDRDFTFVNDVISILDAWFEKKRKGR